MDRRNTANVSDTKVTIGEGFSKRRLQFYERLISSSSSGSQHEDDTIDQEEEEKKQKIFSIGTPTGRQFQTLVKYQKEKKVTSESRTKLFERSTSASEDEKNSPIQWGKKPHFNLFQKTVPGKFNHPAKKESTGGGCRAKSKLCLRRCIDVVFRSKRDKYKVVKGLIGAVCGLLLGAATFLGLVYALEFPMKESVIASAATTVILCISLAFSTRCRVVICLCMPTLSLKSGRLVLTTLAAALMLSGPLRTLSMNSTELAIMPSCTADLLYNESIKLQEMARAPFEEFKPKMEKAIDDLRAQMSGLKGVWNKAKGSFEWITDIQDETDRWVDENLGSNPFTSWIKAIPDKMFGGLAKKVNNVVRDVDGRLSFGLVVDDLLKANVIATPKRNEIVTNIREDVERKLALVDEILIYVKRITSLTILIIVIQSYLYLRRTLNIDSHDNLYITPLFVKVDEQSKKQGKSSLLPLTPSERKLITDKRHIKMSTVEIKSMIRGLIPTLVTVLGAALVLLGDYALYEGIKYIQQVNEMQIDIDQFTDITVEKETGGRPNTEEFSILQDARHKININVCLPVGTEPDHHQYIGIGVVYVVLLLTVIFQAYLIRLRHFMALYFYPDIEIGRVKALHRMLAKQRVLTLLSLKDDLIEKRRVYKASVVKKTKMSPCLEKLRKLCSCYLRRKKQCFICKRSENKSVEIKKCLSCRQYFCQECKDLVIRKFDCLCLDITINPLYNTITDSDFEQLDEETHGSSEV